MADPKPLPNPKYNWFQAWMIAWWYNRLFSAETGLIPSLIKLSKERQS